MEISNVQVYGLEESIRGAKFPMATDVNKLTSKLTPGMEALAKASPGSGHDQFLTGIIVQFDLKFSLKAWTEWQRYHFVDFISSQSTMHRSTKFDISNQCNQYVDPRAIELLKELVDNYNNNPTSDNYLKCLYNIPTGFELTARVSTNYRSLKTQYYQRKTHRLPEWREYCKWIETLPMADKLICNQKEDLTDEH